MRALLISLALLGVAACGRACCMEKCQGILYTCQRDSAKEQVNQCFELTNTCISTCAGVPEN
jgi:hypothetical protein